MKLQQLIFEIKVSNPKLKFTIDEDVLIFNSLEGDITYNHVEFEIFLPDVSVDDFKVYR